MCICLLVLDIPALETQGYFRAIWATEVLAFYNERVDIGYWTWAILMSNIPVISRFITQGLHEVFIWIQGMFTE